MGYAHELDVILVSAKLSELLESNTYQTFRVTLNKMEEGYMQVRKNPYTDMLAKLYYEEAEHSGPSTMLYRASSTPMMMPKGTLRKSC